MIIFSGLPLLEYLNLTDCSKLTGGIMEIFKGKRVFQGNKARQIFRQTNISYPLIRTRTCAFQRVRNVRFSENLACFVSLKHPF